MWRWIKYRVHIAPETFLTEIVVLWRCLMEFFIPYLYTSCTYSTQITTCISRFYCYNSWNLYHWSNIGLNHFRKCLLLFSWSLISNVSSLVSWICSKTVVGLLAPRWPSQLRWIKYQTNDRTVIILRVEITHLWLRPHHTFFHGTVFAWVVLDLVTTFIPLIKQGSWNKPVWWLFKHFVEFEVFLL